MFIVLGICIQLCAPTALFVINVVNKQFGKVLFANILEINTILFLFTYISFDLFTIALNFSTTIGKVLDAKRRHAVLPFKVKFYKM